MYAAHLMAEGIKIARAIDCSGTELLEVFGILALASLGSAAVVAFLLRRKE